MAVKPPPPLRTLVMLGDIMLGRYVDDAISAWGPRRAGVWHDTLPLLCPPTTRQLVTGNLECAITEYPHPTPNKTFNFKLSPSNAGVLTDANIKFVSLANNHSLDYHEQGLLDTMSTLDSKGIKYAGVGYKEEAAAPVTDTSTSTRVSFLSFSDHYKEWAATDTKRGINYINPASYDREHLREQIQSAASTADRLIVFVHWGSNWCWHPPASIQTLAHDFIDFGADAVFGHSAHHIQGIEVRHGRYPIIYGAGGFIDDYALREEYRNDLGFVYVLHVGGDVGQEIEVWTALELMPIQIVHQWRQRDDPDPHPPYFSFVKQAKGGEKEWLGETIKRLSQEQFGTKVMDRGDGEGFYITLR